MLTPSQIEGDPARILRVLLAESSTSAMDEARADRESGLMYTYTFLATLVGLFLVALTIVLRSRRAERRRMRTLEEAIRNGTYVLGGQKKEDEAQNKPVLWETWVKSDERGHSVDRISEQDGYEIGSVGWRNVMPLSLQIVQTTTLDPRVMSSTANTEAPPSSPSPTPSVVSGSTRSSSIHIFNRPKALITSQRPDRTRSPSPPPSHSVISDVYPPSETNSVPSVKATDATSLSPLQDINALGASTSTKPVASATMRVSLLVVLPSPRPTKNGGLGKDELPLMDVGILGIEVNSEAENEKGGFRQEELSA
ncbi:hypothetical protein AAF712_012444 [Marasmius tenuissimus]|uniref:Uncharacterized protein n=1 Tax=Marasmius tenuissimus TaxID=585030 RepID=A0ABR2ZJ29_9AGAR